MKRKPTPSDAQPALTLRPETPALPERVEAWEYTFEREPWRVWKSAELAAEFALTLADLPAFHLAVSALPRGGMIVRRLFGMMPVLPPPGTPEEELQTWGAPELCAALGITRAQLQQELDTVRGVWSGRRKNEDGRLKMEDGQDRAPSSILHPPSSPGELALTDPKQILARHGFPEIRFQSSEETDRFMKRVDLFEPLLRETMAGGLARELLIQGLRMDRLDQELDAPDARRGSKDWRETLKLRGELGDRFETLAKLLFEKCPWAAQVAGKVNLKGNLSEITEGIRAYRARGDTQLVDGIFTALEILVQCRMSVQAPEPKYRAGLSVYLNAARAGLMDPNWTSPFSPKQLRRITKAWSAAYLEMAREDGDPLPDLVEGGEYEPLPTVVVVEQIVTENPEK